MGNKIIAESMETRSQVQKHSICKLDKKCSENESPLPLVMSEFYKEW